MLSPSPAHFCRVASVLAAALALAGAVPTRAQFPTRPFRDWRTVDTEHFAFHFPRELEPWTLDVAAHMEAVRSAVGAVVGSVPRRKVHVIVDDPYNLANGSAIPPLDWPMMVLWASPPTPRQEIGHFRTWGEILTVHEFAHLAHLTWPSRNPFQRNLWRILPAELGPVLRRSPRWVIEGYATYVEGQVTGSGRPYNVWRPAVLRQWALEGRLPAYGQLNALNGYEGGAFAYLAGSAYLEWLARRQGDSSLVHLWRRLSARRNRSFGQAFAGLYGDAPDVLYGRFVAELTGSALAVERLITQGGGVVAGEIVQRLTWETGDPAISRDGRHVAVVLRAERRPARVVVWRTGPDSAAPRIRRRRPSRQRLDPLDVPDRRFFPPPRRAVATLNPLAGLPFDEPRFFRDGERVLVSRLTPRGDGSLTSDLFIWNYRRRALRRVTRGAGIRSADPSPDGRTAAAARCAGGHCDLVTVDLATGMVTTRLEGTSETSFHRPRVSPNGREVAFSVQRSGRWRVGVAELSGRSMRLVDPDDGAARYDVTWLPGGRGLAWVSEAGGIPNVETIESQSGAVRPVTRVTGAALAPEPNAADGSIWFLSLHSRGLDVRRISGDSVRDAPRVALTPHLAPAVPVHPATAPERLRRAAAGPVLPYGLGPRQTRWFPGFAATADGVGGEVVLSNADPVGRLALRLTGAFGEPSVWRGGSVGATWRARASISAQAYVAQNEPSRTFTGDLAGELDVRLAGGDLRLEFAQDYWSVRHRYRVGGALAGVEPIAAVTGPADPGRTRALGYAELQGSYRQRVGELRFAQSLSAHADAGGIGGERFVRGMASGAFTVAGPLPFGGVQAWATYGELGGTSDPFERFAVGGERSPLIEDAVLAQRVPMPALPTGVATGDRVFAFRVALPTGPLFPYYWGASAAARGEPFRRWHRVVGAELRVGTEALPLVALPDVQLVAGYGRSLDAPYQRGNRVYAALSYRR